MPAQLTFNDLSGQSPRPFVHAAYGRLRMFDLIITNAGDEPAQKIRFELGETAEVPDVRFVRYEDVAPPLNQTRRLDDIEPGNNIAVSPGIRQDDNAAYVVAQVQYTDSSGQKLKSRVCYRIVDGALAAFPE